MIGYRPIRYVVCSVMWSVTGNLFGYVISLYSNVMCYVTGRVMGLFWGMVRVIFKTLK